MSIHRLERRESGTDVFEGRGVAGEEDGEMIVCVAHPLRGNEEENRQLLNREGEK